MLRRVVLRLRLRKVNKSHFCSALLCDLVVVDLCGRRRCTRLSFRFRIVLSKLSFRFRIVCLALSDQRRGTAFHFQSLMPLFLILLLFFQQKATFSSHESSASPCPTGVEARPCTPKVWCRSCSFFVCSSSRRLLFPLLSFLHLSSLGCPRISCSLLFPLGWVVLA